jgi:hypothetical protein
MTSSAIAYNLEYLLGGKLWQAIGESEEGEWRMIFRS